MSRTQRDNSDMQSRAAIKVLLILVLALPVLQAVLAWVGRLFQALNDAATATVLGHVSTATGVIWLASVVGLVVALALVTLNGPDEPEL